MSAKILLNKEYSVINDVTISDGKGSTTQIDHIIVSPYGIFVAEVKHYAGWLYGNSGQKQWTQKFPGKSFRFQNPLHQNYKHVKCIAGVLVENVPNLPAESLHCLIIFVGDFKFKTEFPANMKMNTIFEAGSEV